MDVMNKILFLEKKRILELENITLHPSEIHLLLLVSRAEHINATGIADHLGVTRGAVSQTISRLVKKGILRKNRDPYSKNELNLDLTDLGRVAIDKFRQKSLFVNREFDHCLSSFTGEEREVIGNFLESMAKVLDKII